MKKAIKQFGFKLIVVLCVISTFWCFVASTPVSYATSKVKTDEFYYSGTTKGSYSVDKSFLAKLIESLDGILDYLLGIITMAFRIPLIGWTELLERCLTWILEGAAGVNITVDKMSTSLVDVGDYITIDAIVFNRILFFNVNVFNLEVSEKYDSLGREVNIEKGEKSDIAPDSLIVILKEAIAGWYYSFRLISIMIMLILLIYIGLKLAITSSTKEKALYKRVLTDWVVGMILVFSIHYIILAMLTINEVLVEQISNMKLGYGIETPMEVYEYGIKDRAETGVTDTDMEISIYDEVRTRAYDAKLSVGMTGMIMYMVLVYYAYKFSFLYLKRYLVVAVLVMMAPFVAVSYAYNKVKTGKTVIFKNWFKELLFMILLQSIHALMYVIFFEGALAISLSSIGGMILAFVMLNFMSKAEEIFRKIFDIKGNLTSDVAGSKLGDIKKAVANVSMGMVGAKAAVATTKLAGRVASKPFRVAGNLGFGLAMQHNANKLEEENKRIEKNRALSEAEKNKLSREELYTKKELREIDEINRQNMLKLGAIAKAIKTGKDNRSAKDEKLIAELMKSIPMKNANDEPMTEEEYINNFYDNKDQYIKDFDKATTKKAVFKHEVSKKWNEIMNPFQYVEREKDKAGNVIKDGKYKRKKTTYEHEDWGPLAKRFSAKQDGTGITFGKYINADYLLNLDSKQRAALKAQTALIKDSILGFSGILLGLPLVVAEPAVGTVFLAKGISSSHRVWGGQGRVRKKNLEGFAMTADGKWHVVGYEGKSVETMAEGMQAYARENYLEIERAKRKHNRKVVKNTKKHKNLYEKIVSGVYTTAKGIDTVGAFNTIVTPTMAPIAVGVAGVAGGVVLTGHLFKNFHANAYMAYVDTVRTARKQAGKNWEEELKSTDSMLNHMAKRYFELEEQKQELKQDRHTEVLEESYKKAVDERIASVENVNDAVLVHETGYDEGIKVQEDENGKKKLSTDAEKKIIDKAIIEIVAKSGIIDFKEYDLRDKAKQSQVKKAITDNLVARGILGKTEKADDIIQDLDKKIVVQKDELQNKQPHAIEDKLVDDSIIELMQENSSVSNPDELDSKDIEKRFSEKYKRMVDNPSDQTSSTIENLSKQKMDTENTDKTTKAQEIMNRVSSTTISSRKAIISAKSQSLDDDKRKLLKSELARKRVRDLDQELIAGQIVIEEATENSEDSIDFSKENKTDDVLRMLELQTQIHKDKTQKELAGNYTQKKGKEALKAYKSQLFNSDGSVDLRVYGDGSRIVDSNKDGSKSVSRTTDKTLLEIINRVNSEKNI